MPDYIHLEVRENEKANNLAKLGNRKENTVSILNLIDNQDAIQNSNAQVKYWWRFEQNRVIKFAFDRYAQIQLQAAIVN